MFQSNRNHICRQTASVLCNMDPPPPYHEDTPQGNTFEPESSSGTDMHKHSGASRFRLSTDAPRLSTTDHNSNDRKIWVCPHRGLSFDQTKKLFSAAIAQPQSWKHDFEPCPRKFCNMNLSSYLKAYRERGRNISHSMNTLVALLQASGPRSPQATFESLLSLEKVATALHGLDVPICPHLRLDQSLILSKFNSECLYTLRNGVHIPCPCSRTNGLGESLKQARNPRGKACCNIGFCPSCRNEGTSTLFLVFVREQTSTADTSNTTLYVFIGRDLSSLESSSHPAWLTHSVRPFELENMATTWQNWEHHIKSFRHSWLQPLFAQEARSSSTTKPSHTEDVASKKTKNDAAVLASIKASYPEGRAWNRAQSWLRRVMNSR